MKKQKQTTAGKKHMTNEDVVRILIQEIADVRRELVEEMHGLHNIVQKDIHSLKADVGMLKTDVSTLITDVKNLRTNVGVLRTEVHQNHISFMKYQGDLDTRVTSLEATVG